MPKNIADILPPERPERRSIRNIPIPAKRRKTDFADGIVPPTSSTPYFPRSTPVTPTSSVDEPLYQHKRATDEEPVFLHRRSTDISSDPNASLRRATDMPREPLPRIRVPDAPFAQPSRRNSSRNLVWGGTTLLVLLFAVGIFSLFTGATVTYTPKSTPLTFNKDTYNASKAGTDTQLLFSVIKLSGEKGAQAPASGEEKVSSKASGKAVVYNNASTDPQKLIRNTRFETPDGKIYRVQNDIVIPGKKGDSPGALEVTLYADQPGSEYNIDLADFTVPGLKGDPRYTTIYARSKTPMTGGLVGISKKVSESDLATAKATLEANLKSELLSEANAQVPSDFILYPDLVQIYYSELPQSSPTAEGVTVNEHADFYGVIFKKADLAKFLTNKKQSSLAEPLEIPDLNNLVASLTSPNIDLLKADQVSFALTGTATAVSVVPEENLKTDLAGTPKASLITTLQKYPGILTASAVIRPFWKSTFPNDPTKIEIRQTSLK